MKDDVRLLPLKNVIHQMVGDVAVMKGGGRIEIPQLAGALVIHHYDLMAFLQQSVDQMGANESGSSRYYHFFGLSHIHLCITSVYRFRAYDNSPWRLSTTLFKALDPGLPCFQ